MTQTRYMKVAKGKLLGIDQYPNFASSGSIMGMKKMYYGSKAYLVRCGSYIYNVPYSIWNQAH